MSDEERFEAGQVLYLERLLNRKWFRKGHIRLEDYIAERQEEARQYREQWLRAVEQERQKVHAEFEEWKKNHLNHEADDLWAEVERLKGLLTEQGILLSRLGIEKPELDALVQASWRTVAERQREADRKAFAAWLREVHATGVPHETPEVLADAVDAGEVTPPLVTEGDK